MGSKSVAERPDKLPQPLARAIHAKREAAKWAVFCENQLRSGVSDRGASMRRLGEAYVGLARAGSALSTECSKEGFPPAFRPRPKWHAAAVDKTQKCTNQVSQDIPQPLIK